MHNKAFYRVAASMLLIALCVVLSRQQVFAENEEKLYKWRMQSLLPASMIPDEQVFADLVNTLSDGEIQIKLFADGSLVPFPEMLNAVSKNVVQLCSTVPSGYDVLEAGAFYSEVPFGWNNPSDAMSLIYDFKDGKLLKLAREECAKQGVYYLGPILSERMVLISTRPLKTIEDVKGFMCATPSAGSAEFIQQIGGVSNFIPAEEMYMALSNNIIQGVFYGGAKTYDDMGLGEVAKYYNVPNLVYPAVSAYMINQNVWNTLPKRLQVVLETATKMESYYLISKYNHLNYESLKKLKKMGVQTVHMTPELIDYMETAAHKTWEKLGERGPTAKQALEIIKEWNALTRN